MWTLIFLFLMCDPYPVLHVTEYPTLKHTEPVKVSVEAPPTKKMLFFEMNGCGGCVTFKKKDFPHLHKSGWQKGRHYEIVDQSDLEFWDEQCTKYGVTHFPALVLIQDKIPPIKVEATPTTPLTYTVFANLYNGVKPVLAKPKAARTGYPVRQITWLAGDWTHVAWHEPRLDHNWLRSLTYSELQSLHSDCHEGTVQWNFVVLKGN